MIEDIPPELAELFAAERAAPAAGLSARSAVRAKLASTVGKAALGSGSAASLAVLGKLLAVFALVGGIGAAVHFATGDEPTAVAPTVVVSTPPEAIALPAVALPAVALPAPDAAPVIARAPAVRAPLPPSAPSEISLLADAYRALSSHDPARALASLDADVSAHPAGGLAEERDALRVTALADLHRTDDAAAAAARFVAAYPHSLHRAAVERALTPPQESP